MNDRLSFAVDGDLVEETGDSEEVLSSVRLLLDTRPWFCQGRLRWRDAVSGSKPSHF